MLLRTLLVAAVLVPATTASAASFHHAEYDLDVTGIQVIDWQYRSDSYPDPLPGWVTGTGTATLGWHTTRPLRMWGQWSDGRIGGRTYPFSFEGPYNRPRIRATVERSADVTALARMPVCEGGKLDPECRVLPSPAKVPQSCGRRTPTIAIDVAQPSFDRSLLDVKSKETFARLYRDCAPDSGAITAAYELAYPLEMRFAGAIAKIKRLRPGRQVKLRRTVEAGCPLPVAANRYARCVTTDVTVEVRRRR